MHASYLQALIKTNAAKIASKHAMHDMCVDHARHHRARDDKSLMYEEFDNAAKYRKQLSRLHMIQKALLAELKSHYRCNRIDAKVRKLKCLGGEVPAGFCELTSVEYEAGLDKLLAAQKMKKLN